MVESRLVINKLSKYKTAQFTVRILVIRLYLS
jgi:hypothetical protein